MNRPFRKEETQIAENGLNSVQTQLGKGKIIIITMRYHLFRSDWQKF